MNSKPVVIIGAGPAGLTAAYDLANRGIDPIVFEKGDRVGGISRTEVYKDYYFDIGGHRFFTKMDRINDLWHEMLGKDFRKVRRMSRIYYNGRFFNYPLSFSNALSNLGLVESLLIVLSYINAQIHPHPKEETFEQWVSNRFGKRLFRTFFKAYTEKVWGIPCDKIQADWAAQRIKGLSLTAAVSNALFGVKTAKSLIDEFYYPVKGPGMMWHRFQQAIEGKGGQVRLAAETVGLRHADGRIVSIVNQYEGVREELPVHQLISSIPLTRLVALLDPPPPEAVLNAAGKLSYRDFLIVGLIIDREELFPDQWIYIHNPDVTVGRIQNFKNWSAAMVPDPRMTSVGMEYFCTQGDELWSMPDGELAALASRELSAIGFSKADEVVDSVVIRQPGAYPIYNDNYREQIGVIREYLATIDNLQTIGRNGMHRYNNMDQSMMVGRLAADNLFGAEHDLWAVNEEKEYLESGKENDARRRAARKVLSQAFAKMDKLAFAVAVGSVSGLLLFLSTFLLVLKGGDAVGPNLQLLGQYFKGYTVTVSGSFYALAYGFVWGFLFGWLFAYVRNLLLALYIYRARKKAELVSLRDFFDNL